MNNQNNALTPMLLEMRYELESNRLSVVLVPQRNPSNSGACVRSAVQTNCQWYQDICSDFESSRRKQYRNFKTKVKRKEILRILNRLISGNTCRSKYADWVLERAKTETENLFLGTPF